MKDLLLELGCEELPPLKLQQLSTALKDEFAILLNDKKLSFSEIIAYDSPRRLAIVVKNLSEKQPDIENLRRGPAEKVAFDENNNPNKALLGFIKSCGTSLENLEKITTDKGVWMGINIKTIGQKTIDLIPEIFKTTLNKLPIAKRMRWGDLKDEFVRPVHWMAAIFGDELVPINLFGISSDIYSYGHRFHHPDKIAVNPKDYVADLENAKVIVDFEKRKNLIKTQVENLAQKLGGVVKINQDLLREVTNLVEFPIALAGNFENRFLDIPPEATVAFMEGHQKFFAVFDENNKLLPHFITISNIQSKDEKVVIAGNEKVIRPRLADALFFWQQDKKLNLTEQTNKLKTVVYQKQLGTVLDKVERVSQLSQHLSNILGENTENTKQVAQLSKADLLSNMVGEFPKLQGTMGKYYAINSGVKKEVALAIEEHYLPRYADDKLPSTKIGQIVAIADRVDTLTGIFSIGQIPTGDKDPFALRRAALGVLRIIVECKLEINLPELLQKSTDLFNNKSVESVEVLPFILKRFRGMSFVKNYLEVPNSPDVFHTITLSESGSILDFTHREKAVAMFITSDIAKNLIQSNKRIANLLKKSTISNTKIDKNLLTETAENNLYEKLLEKQQDIKSLIKSADYQKSLKLLSSLSPEIDNFFDSVMVMADDEKIKNNRLALLANIRQLFLQIADLSKLP